MSDYMPTDDAGWRRWVNKTIEGLQRRASASLLGSVQAYRVATGETATFGSVATDAVASVAVLFPPGRFTVPPLVTVSEYSGNARATCQASAVTTAGCTITVRNVAGSGSSIGSIIWNAVQMTPDSAAG